MASPIRGLCPPYIRPLRVLKSVGYGLASGRMTYGSYSMNTRESESRIGYVTIVRSDC
jgi:hypothetical protein